MEKESMLRPTNSRRFSSMMTLLLALAILGGGATGASRKAAKSSRPSVRAGAEKYLFVWAGDQARSAPDFLAVVNFDENAPGYGNVVATVPLPGAGASGNEPHHVGLSSDGRVLACGGLLSVLRGQKEVFFFDVSNPSAPVFIFSADPPLSAITDEFYALPDGGFLVTMMGGAGGAHPGRVAEFNNQLQLVTEHP